MSWKDIIRPEDRRQLEQNHEAQKWVKGTKSEMNFIPYVKLHIPHTGMIWLVTEKEPHTSLCFGLCDLAAGFPELGSFCLEEMADLEQSGGLKVEQDLLFKPRLDLRAYADEARTLRYIAA